MSYQLITADVVEWAHNYEGPKFHALFSDFPYDLGFMNKDWDKNAQFQQWGQALLPTLLPGAPALVFGGTRTWHRMAVGMENAGFRMWDTVMYCFGTGFPKGQDTAKLIKKKKTEKSAEWAGYGTLALKPAWEPIVCFQSPFDGTYADLALKHGTGSINIDASRIPTSKADLKKFKRLAGFRKTKSIGGTSAYSGGEVQDRGECYDGTKGRFPSDIIMDTHAQKLLGKQTDASRFFYACKVRKAERNTGIPKGDKNPHPTLKPVSLTTYIARLLLPPKSVGIRRIVVPFSGSGSEVIGCMLAGWDEVVGIELDPEYNRISDLRCAAAAKGEYQKFISK